METTNKVQDMRQRRKNEIETYAGNIVQSKTIPEVTAQLFYDEFGINIPDPLATIPIVFTTGWRHVLQYVQRQPEDEFAINIGGVSLEYVTELSESDKSTNIVPQMYHTKAPIFKKNTHESVPGSNFNEDLLNRYNSWRTVNLAETVAVVENSVLKEVLETFGIDLRVAATVLPLMAATYAVGLQVARETHETVNMYNIFEIDVTEDDAVILTPLAAVKQHLKNDSKNR